ncbi:MAG: MBOAT family protein [Myxococcales bacterium]|nr:MBOAT family protein [Myxococcales bacterium]
MLFNSIEFLLFAAGFFAFWPLVRARDNPRWLYITTLSFFFYGWWDWRYVFLLVGTGLVDFVAALAMVRWPARRKALLIASLGSNIGTLMLFKYLDFGIANASWLAHRLGSDLAIGPIGIVLPVGVSFYTFQSMSYTIEVYRGQLKATHSPLHFFASLSLFPHLVAGPIMRASDLLPQLASHRRPTLDEKWEGARLIAFGFVKKVVIADNLAPVVNQAFGSAHPSQSTTYWWLILAMFAYQIYCDFSGYSDIARGLARWLGYDFNLNFDHPYIAASFAEFWTRWHISLSGWFRDYVYVPLGGSRRGAAIGYRNLWITMVVSGLWHGASWTFVVWGALHALFLSVERWTRWPARLATVPGGRWVSRAIVFVLVLLSWVFFRAESIDQALAITRILLDLPRLTLELAPEIDRNALALLGLIALRQGWVAWRTDSKSTPPWGSRPLFESAVVVVLLVAAVFLRGAGSAFIYFQF